MRVASVQFFLIEYMKIFLDKLKEYIEKGLISDNVHPEDPNIHVFNYTKRAQYEKAWDDVTVQCRGLIVNIKTGEVIAHPFPKFFNYGEKEVQLPVEAPIITDKLDGSLGILYVLNKQPWISTRGSFVSDQALWATDWYRKNVGYLPDEDKTELFEIIFPENRIVVKYDFSGLVHLATIRTRDGLQIPSTHFPEPVRRVKVFPATDLDALAKLDTPNSEGFVIFYPNANLRMKIKFPEYVRLHKIITGLSVKGVWEALRDGSDMKDYFENVPDEFSQWLMKTLESLKGQYSIIEVDAQEEFRKMLEELPVAHRKEYAEKIKQFKYPGLGFALLDKKDIAPIIWKMVRPVGEKAFKDEN